MVFQQVCWDDLRLAHKVCLSQSLSRTSEMLGISNATIIRRLDRLEETLGVTLFIRHPRGYHPTDAGKTLINEFPELLNHFERIKTNICTQQDIISGELSVTIIPEFSSQFNDAMGEYRSEHPNVRLNVFASDELLALNEGSHHVAIRAGKFTSSPDVIVKELYPLRYGYFASQEYVSKHGLPNTEGEFNNHDWVLPSGKKTKISFVQTVLNKINLSSISYQSNNLIDVESAVSHGMGIGPVELGRADLLEKLVPVDACGIDSTNSLHFVYHKDFKRNSRITSFYQHLKAHIDRKYLHLESQ